MRGVRGVRGGGGGWWDRWDEGEGRCVRQMVKDGLIYACFGESA